MSTTTRRKRPWLAALLAFIYPGFGHFYLRAWFRGFVWLGLAMVTAAMSIPESVLTAFQDGGVWAMTDAMAALPLEVLAPLLVIRLLNVVDAYLAAVQRSRPSRRQAEGPSCPACGRDLDEELDFCPWCTTRLEPEEREAAS